MEQRIMMVRGDTYEFTAEFVGMTVDLDSAYFTVRKTYESDVVFQKSIGSGITKVDTGMYHVEIEPADTSNLPYGDYVYDFEVTIGTKVKTILRGMFKIDPDATR